MPTGATSGGSRATSTARSPSRTSRSGSIPKARCRSCRAPTYRYRGELNRALADYDQALRLTPDYIPAFVGRGLTFEKAGDIARARAEYNKALNSKSQFRGDNAGSALETARARLAAFDSGAVQPVIPAAPTRVTSATSIPTPDVTVPIVPKLETGKLGRRVALVIGNADYTSAGRLKNPVHDANIMAASLRAVGFETVTVFDVPWLCPPVLVTVNVTV